MVFVKTVKQTIKSLVMEEVVSLTGAHSTKLS